MFGQPRGRLMLSLRALAPALFRGSSQTNAVSHQLSPPLCLLNICNCPLFDGLALQYLHQLKVPAVKICLFIIKKCFIAQFHLARPPVGNIVFTGFALGLNVHIVQTQGVLNVHNLI